VARFASAPFRAALAKLAARQRFDLVLVEFSLLWPYAGLFTEVPVVLDAHNVEAEIVRQLGESCRNPLKRLLYQREEQYLRRLEEAAWRECALCLAVSEREQAAIAAACGDPGKVESVPNGVDLERFAFQPKERPGRKVLFLGGMEYGPNLDAGRWFLAEIFPRLRNALPAVEVDVVGRQLDKLGDLLAQPGVCPHENVPDVLPLFRGVDLLAVPLRQGAGTRLKILEAMAAGLPVVATAKGCEGIAAVNGEHLLVADGAEAFARAVATLLTDREQAGRLAHNARQLVTERYSWEELGARLEGLLACVARVARGGSA
jgi:glycosyltransferase involved in cell wall biosynthesis